MLFVFKLFAQDVRIEAIHPKCAGAADGRIEVYFKGPLQNSMLRLLDSKNNRQLQMISPVADTFQILNGLPEGDYIVQLVFRGEPEEFQIKLLYPPKLSAEYIEMVAVHRNNESVTADLHLICSGGVPPYTVTWTENAGKQTGDVVKNLSYGIYTAYVTDANMCGPESATFFLFEDEIEKFNQINNKDNEATESESNSDHP
jgi:hypothetical protein